MKTVKERNKQTDTIPSDKKINAGGLNTTLELLKFIQCEKNKKRRREMLLGATWKSEVTKPSNQQYLHLSSAPAPRHGPFLKYRNKRLLRSRCSTFGEISQYFHFVFPLKAKDDTVVVLKSICISGVGLRGAWKWGQKVSDKIDFSYKSMCTLAYQTLFHSRIPPLKLVKFSPWSWLYSGWFDTCLY